MTRHKNTDGKLGQALRKIALRYPEAEEGIACKGTAVECSAFKARNKTFLFVGAAEVRLKLQQSLAEATKLAVKEPGRYQVGFLGWIKATLNHGESPPPGLFERWIDESYRLIVHKHLVAMLPECDVPTTGSPKAAKKKPARKKSTNTRRKD